MKRKFEVVLKLEKEGLEQAKKEFDEGSITKENKIIFLIRGNKNSSFESVTKEIKRLMNFYHIRNFEISNIKEINANATLGTI